MTTVVRVAAVIALTSHRSLLRSLWFLNARSVYIRYSWRSRWGGRRKTIRLMIHWHLRAKKKPRESVSRNDPLTDFNDRKSSKSPLNLPNNALSPTYHHQLPTVRKPHPANSLVNPRTLSLSKWPQLPAKPALTQVLLSHAVRSPYEHPQPPQSKQTLTQNLTPKHQHHPWPRSHSQSQPRLSATASLTPPTETSRPLSVTQSELAVNHQWLLSRDARSADKSRVCSMHTQSMATCPMCSITIVIATIRNRYGTVWITVAISGVSRRWRGNHSWVQ